MTSKFRNFMVGMIVLAICPVLSFAQTNADGIGVQEKQVRADEGRNQQKSSISDNSEWIKAATRTYSPSSWDLLMKYEKMPAEIDGERKGWWIVTLKKPVGTFDHLKGENNKVDLIDRMALNVRVVDLALQRHDLFRYAKDNKMQMDWDHAEVLLNFPPAKSCFISFPLKSLFPAAAIAEGIPKDRQTFYYDTYVKGGSITQRFGIVGLLEEYHGYLIGSKFYFDMLEAYKTLEGTDTNGFFEWARSSQSTMAAFYELDYFIREYLLYMKEHKPADYEALKAHKPFAEAYGMIRSSYERLMEQYFALIDAEMKRLNSPERIRIGLDNGLLWIRSADGRNVTGTHVLPEREKLIALLNSDRYSAVIKDFPKM